MRKHKKRIRYKFNINQNKKGQIFILIAVVVVLMLYTVIANYNYIKESIGLENYQELRDNFNSEVPKVMNRAIYITTDPAKCQTATPDPNCPVKAVEDFSAEYQKHASQIDPNFGNVIIVKDPYTGNIIVKNLLANGKYLKIDATNYKGESIKLGLLSDASSEVTGTITVKGIGSVPAHARPSAFGENYTRAQMGSVRSLDIWIEGYDVPISIDVQAGEIHRVSNSHDSKGNIAVDVVNQ